jgi:hypothetical protein
VILQLKRSKSRPVDELSVQEKNRKSHAGAKGQEKGNGKAGGVGTVIFKMRPIDMWAKKPQSSLSLPCHHFCSPNNHFPCLCNRLCFRGCARSDSAGQMQLDRGAGGQIS